MINLLLLVYDSPLHSAFDGVRMVELKESLEGRVWMEGANGRFLAPNICLLGQQGRNLGEPVIMSLFFLECYRRPFWTLFIWTCVLNAFWDSITWEIWRERTGKKILHFFLFSHWKISSSAQWPRMAPFVSLLTSTVTVSLFLLGVKYKGIFSFPLTLDWRLSAGRTHSHPEMHRETYYPKIVLRI